MVTKSCTPANGSSLNHRYLAAGWDSSPVDNYRYEQEHAGKREAIN